MSEGTDVPKDDIIVFRTVAEVEATEDPAQDMEIFSERHQHAPPLSQQPISRYQRRGKRTRLALLACIVLLSTIIVILGEQIIQAKASLSTAGQGVGS